jgi:tRNA pseudouridine38-40 synthase
MRYFVELSFLGTNYHGWQRQVGQVSVQETLENAFSTILRTEIAITGCGRTDTGVHAQAYYAHFDLECATGEDFKNRINRFLPNDICIHRIIPVPDEAHARFDATRRTYQYFIKFNKDPFSLDKSYYFPFRSKADLNLLQKAALAIRKHEDFYPFCKSNSNVQHYRCELYQADWIFDDTGAIFTISANRFLRGMVRLIVGACLQIAIGKITLDELEHALQTQTLIRGSLSAPPQGLHLVKIEYPQVIIAQ